MSLVYVLYVLTVVVSIPTIWWSCKVFSTWVNYYTLTNIWWLFFTLCQMSFNIYERPIDFEVFMIFLLGLNVFNLTILFIKKPRKINKPKDIMLKLGYRRILELFVIIFYLPQAIFNYKLIESGVELWEINYMYWNELRNTGNYLNDFLLQSIVAPLGFLLVSTTFFKGYINYNKKKFVITLFFSIIITIENLIVTGGGRTEVIFFAFVVIVSYLLSITKEGKNYLMPIKKTNVIIFSLVSVFLLSWASEGRNASGDGIVEQALIGFSVYPPLFEYYLNNTRCFDNNTFGLTFFEPIIIIIQYPIKHLFNLEFYPERINSITQQFHYIPALGKELNAMVSTYWVYFRDFGWLGIIIGPVLTSFILKSLYDFCRNNYFYMCTFVYVLVLCLSSEFIFDGIFVYIFIFMILVKKISVVK